MDKERTVKGNSVQMYIQVLDFYNELYKRIRTIIIKTCSVIIFLSLACFYFFIGHPKLEGMLFSSRSYGDSGFPFNSFVLLRMSQLNQLPQTAARVQTSVSQKLLLPKPKLLGPFATPFWPGQVKKGLEKIYDLRNVLLLTLSVNCFRTNRLK